MRSALKLAGRCESACASSIRIMDNEVRKAALETLTLSHDTQKKGVSLNFVGEGKRATSGSGYVIENPIWKTNYRLRSGQGEGG